MSSLTSEMINEKMLKDTVDKYKETIREIGNTYNAPLIYIGMVLQTFVDHGKTEIEGLIKGVISDDFLDLSIDVGDENLWLYLGPYKFVEDYINSLGLLAKSESNPLCDDGRDKRTRSSLINLSLLTSEMVEKRISELLEKGIVGKGDLYTAERDGADLVDVDDKITQILPGGEYFKDFIVLLSELNERSGCGIELPSVSDFVDLGRRFIALVKENSELKEKCSLTAGEVKKIEGEKIKVENELKRIQKQLSEAWKYATDGVYSSHGGVKVVKIIDSSNLNGITPSTDIEKVGVFNNEEFGLVSKENEEKAKLLDKGTHDIYKKETEGVYDRTTQIVLTKKEVEQKEKTRKEENTLREDLLANDLRIKGNVLRYELTLRCYKHKRKKKAKKGIRDNAELELAMIFPYIKTIASLFVDVDYSKLNRAEMLLLKFVKAELKFVSGWRNVKPYAELRDELKKDAISDAFLQWLESARVAAFSAANLMTDSMVQCEIGGATDKDNLMAQLLGAAIAGYGAEDIKKTF